MAQRILVNTENGVTMAMPLDGEKMESLATWLCKTEAYHEKADPTNADEWTDFKQRQWDELIQKQGYCNICRDFAGRLLEFLEGGNDPL